MKFELSTYSLNKKLGEKINLSEIKVLSEGNELNSSLYTRTVTGGRFETDAKNADIIKPCQIAKYTIAYKSTVDGEDVQICTIEVEDVTPEVVVNHKGDEIDVKGNTVKLPSYTINHPCTTFAVGKVATYVKVVRSSFIGNDISYTVKPEKDGTFTVDLLEHGTNNNTEPCVGEYTVTYKAISPTGIEAEKILTFNVGAGTKKAAPKKKEKKSGGKTKNRINAIVISLVIVMSIVLGVTFSTGALDDLINKGDDTEQTPGDGSTEGGSSGSYEQEELEAVVLTNVASCYDYGERYLEKALAYEIKYSGSFSANYSLAGISVKIDESLTGRTKKLDTVNYTYLDIKKNSNSDLGGNMFVRYFDIDRREMWNQMNKKAKAFPDGDWTVTPMNDYALFLNRKRGKSYIKVDGSTIRNEYGGIKFNGTNWVYTVDVDPTAALVNYKPSIDSMFKIFIDDFRYNFTKLTVCGTYTKYGQPLEIDYTVYCNLTVTYKGKEFDIKGAKLNFTETFSNYNKTNMVLEDEFTGKVGM